MESRVSLKSKLLQKSILEAITLSSNGKAIPIAYRRIDYYIYQITFMEIPTETSIKRHIFAYTLKGDTAKDIFTPMHYEYQRGGNTFRKATEMCWSYRRRLDLAFKILKASDDDSDPEIEIVDFVTTKNKLWCVIKTSHSFLAISEDGDLLIPNQKTRYKRVVRKLQELKKIATN